MHFAWVAPIACQSNRVHAVVNTWLLVYITYGEKETKTHNKSGWTIYIRNVKHAHAFLAQDNKLATHAVYGMSIIGNLC